MDAYEAKPIELVPETDHNHSQDQNQKRSIKLTQNDEVVALIEPLISFWIVSKNGHLSKIKEDSFNLKIKSIDASSNNNMRFSLSNDMRILSLSFINEENQPGIIAWEIDDKDMYQRIIVSNRLKEALKL